MTNKVVARGSRGTLVVDENLEGIDAELRGKNNYDPKGYILPSAFC
jgi:hypothetical protein